MLTLVEAHNFRCLRYISRPLGPVHTLVGPNASGKTTFLNVVRFLGDFVSGGLDQALGQALGEAGANPGDLLWQHQGQSFELAVEAKIPEEIVQVLSESLVDEGHYDCVRYEVSIAVNQDTGEASILSERLRLLPVSSAVPRQVALFPDPPVRPRGGTLISAGTQRGTRTVATKVPGGNDNYYPETYSRKGRGWVPAFQFGPRRSTLGNLPADEIKFPVAIWFRNLLTQGVQPLVLNSSLMRSGSPPSLRQGFRVDGSNVPWVIWDLQNRAPERLGQWLAHIRTALPDLADIRTIERPEDRHRYIVFEYTGGAGGTYSIPSWLASDGTLRLLALTLPAYLPELRGIYLIEEPENGVHPRAVETLFQSLSSVYGAQVLLATHSPVILSLAEPEQVLCFAKNADGATDIVSGDQHPALRSWQGETSLGELFAAGVLS